MPEGPQVRRAGNLIESHVGALITEISHPPSRPVWELPLPVKIESVRVIGKNLFIYLDNDQVIYNHMLMWGSWRASCDVSGKKRLNTCFTTSKGCIGYFGGGILKLIDAPEAEKLQRRLGPDILSSATPEEAFGPLVSSTLPIGEALLAQDLVSGIGNIYKSEGMFAAKIHPLIPARQIEPKTYQRLYAFLKPQMIADVRRPGPITTTTSEMIKAGKRNFVYRRWHQPCAICGTLIERIYQGSGLKRSTYFCPNCQSIKT